jgi:hypothetical protein
MMIDQRDRDEEDTDHSRVGLLTEEIHHYHLDYVYACIFAVLGLTMLSGWNTWIQLTDYFKQRLMNSTFAGNFEGYITAIFQICNIFTLGLFLSKPRLVSQQTRLFGGFALMIVVFLFTAVLSLWTSLHPTIYFLLNLVLVGVSSFASACLGQIMGLAAMYPWYSIIAVNSGQGISGLVPSLIQLSEQQRHGHESADSIFLKSFAAIFYSLISIACYLFLIRHDKVNHQPEYESAEISAEQDNHYQETLHILKAVKLPFISVYLNMAITLSIFPAITAFVDFSEFRSLAFYQL